MNKNFIKITAHDGQSMILRTDLIENVVDKRAALDNFGNENHRIKAAISYMKKNSEEIVYTQQNIDEIFDVSK